MTDTNFRVSTITRLGRGVIIIALLLLCSGCMVTPPMVDPYSTLLPPNSKIADSNTIFPATSLKKETVYLVVGANFVTYVDRWNVFQKKSEEGGNLVYSREVLLDGMAQWSPSKTTTLVATNLQKHFRKVIVVNDFAVAKSQSAKWIVMFDHAYVQTSTATAAWTNTTTLDLLDGDFRRVVSATSSESKDYGGAWNEGDVQRFMVYRGNDVLKSVQKTLAQFDMKMAAAPVK